MGRGGSRIGRLARPMAGAVVALLAAACGPLPDDVDGLLMAGPGDPFPSPLYLAADGRVDLGRLPPVAGAPVPPSTWRVGFSPAQVAVVRLDGVDPAALPDPAAPTPGQGGVRLVDRTARRWLPVMAELDAGAEPGPASLLVRPLERLPPGHRVAVVVTTAATARPERFEQLLSRRPPASIAQLREPFVELVDDLVELGMPEEEIAFAWDFPIDDPLRVTRSAIATLPAAPLTITWDEVREGDAAGPLAYRTARGSFAVPAILDADGRLRVDEAGQVSADGTILADVFVHVPASAAGAEPGTVPVVLFGHGIFGTPDLYLDLDDPTDVSRLAEAGPFILVATRFTGLSRPDVALALSAANDLGKLPALTDQLVQAQVALRALAEHVADGHLASDPVLRGPDGRSLASAATPAYYGISLGAIQGAVAVGTGLPVDAAVLHVGGSMWSTMLERSSNFLVFDGVVRNVVPDPASRAELLAWTQLHWDLVDPLSGELASVDAPILLQEALGDEQVPNLTTRVLARSAGWPAVGPMVDAPWGLERIEPAPSPMSAFVQFDPELPLPDETNRPAEVTGAHATPRGWPGHRAQTVTFLRPATRGVVVHPCGDAPCSASNPGG